MLAAATLGATHVAADDWPQFRGPSRDLSSNEQGLLKEWPVGGPPRAWLFQDCGVGYGGPAIADGRLYVLGGRSGAATLIAIDTGTGQEVWSRRLGQEYDNAWGNGPRSTPTVDGDRVYCLTGRGDLACVAAADGSVVWQASMQELGGSIPVWGYSESPLVDGGTVLCTPGGPEGSVAALDKLTGEVRWRSTDVTSPAHYASIVPATLAGTPQYVQLLPDRLVGLAKADGALLWEAAWPGRVAVVPTPIVDGDRVYATSGYGVGSMLVTVDAGGGVKQQYANKVMKNHHGGVILLGGHVYGHSDRVGWVCQHLVTGDRVWRERSALEKGSLGYADGMLYLLGEATGDVVLVRPTPEGWQERGRFTLDPQTKIRKQRGAIWTHPVVAGGRLYLRDQDLLYCYDVRDPAAATP
ncbi:MAG: PQQ-binding-like beta-propeller repeat protein [Planctomycetota bacterium]